MNMDRSPSTSPSTDAAVNTKSTQVPTASSNTAASAALNKIVNVLNTKITLPTLPKRLVADIHLHERLAKQKEALAFLSAHQAVTQGNVHLAAQLITETIAQLLGNEYTGIWLFNEQEDCLNVVDEYVLSRSVHGAEDEYTRNEYPGWFETIMSKSQLIANSEMDMFNNKPEFFENNQKWGIKSGLETVIYAYGEEGKAVGLLGSDDNQEREFFEDEIIFHQQIAQLMAIAIHNQRYHLLEMQISKKEQFVHEQRRVVHELMNLKALHNGDTKNTFDFICKQLVELYDVHGCTLWQVFDRTDQLTCVSSYDVKTGYAQDLAAYDIERSKTPIYFDVIASGRCFAVADVAQDLHLSELYDEQLAPEGIVSVLDMGIFHHKKLIGSICLDATLPRQWDNSDKLFLTEIAELICECILNKENQWLASQLRILSTAIEHTPCAIFAVDAHQQIQYCNGHFQHAMGIDKDKLLGMPINRLSVAETSVPDFSRMLTAVRAGKPWQGAVELKNSAGGMQHFKLTATPLFDQAVATGEVVFFCE